MDLFDIHQAGQIRRANARISGAESAMQDQVRRAKDEVADLEERVEKLMLMCESMWDLVCQTTGLTDAHLEYRFWELDSADGSEDGKKTIRAADCGCGAKVAPRLTNCQFCGEPAPTRSPWERI